MTDVGRAANDQFETVPPPVNGRGLGGGKDVAKAHPAATNALRAQVSLPLPFTGGEWQETTQIRPLGRRLT